MSKKQYVWALVRGKRAAPSSLDSRVTELVAGTCEHISVFLSRTDAEEEAKAQIKLSTKSGRYVLRYSVADESLWSRDGDERRDEAWVSVARYELRR